MEGEERTKKSQGLKFKGRRKIAGSKVEWLEELEEAGRLEEERVSEKAGRAGKEGRLVEKEMMKKEGWMKGETRESELWISLSFRFLFINFSQNYLVRKINPTQLRFTKKDQRKNSYFPRKETRIWRETRT